MRDALAEWLKDLIDACKAHCNAKEMAFVNSVSDLTEEDLDYLRFKIIFKLRRQKNG